MDSDDLGHASGISKPYSSLLPTGQEQLSKQPALTQCPRRMPLSVDGYFRGGRYFLHGFLQLVHVPSLAGTATEDSLDPHNLR